MKANSKTLGAFATSAVVVGGILLATPHVVAQTSRTNLRTSAPSREQQQVQLQLAERTRQLAEQYSDRRFGTEEDPVESPPPPQSEAEDFQRSTARAQASRLTAGTMGSGDMTMEMNDAPMMMANLDAEPVAEHLPNLPGSGFGMSTTLLALGLAGAVSGRRKMQRQ